jgi:hypothetical protein
MRWKEALLKHSQDNNLGKSDADIEAEVLHYLYGKYAELSDHNARVNGVRSRRLHFGIRFLTYTMVLAFVGGIISVVASFPKEDKPYKVMIIPAPVAGGM